MSNNKIVATIQRSHGSEGIPYIETGVFDADTPACVILQWASKRYADGKTDEPWWRYKDINVTLSNAQIKETNGKD